MGDIGKLEQFIMYWKHRLLCFFGRHDFDVHEVYTHGPYGPGDSRIYVSGCGWCGKLIYGAKDENEH